MGNKWELWPESKLGKVAVILSGITALIWLSLPVLVQTLSRVDFERVVGIGFVVALITLSLVALILGWVSFGFKKDRSIMLLIAASLMTAIIALAAVGELIEALIMS